MFKKSKNWVIGYLCIVLAFLIVIGFSVYKIDPFFHYHKPLTDQYFYYLNNERSQNDGIAKHFDYDAIITGTSMTECFKTSELDKLFGTNSIKLPFSGGSYKEINEIVKTALDKNPNLKMVVRCLDQDRFLQDKDWMRSDLGEFPTYLYDDNIWNDVKYLFNRDVVFSRISTMAVKRLENIEPGITTFDAYADWSKNYTYGIHSVSTHGLSIKVPEEQQELTEEEKGILLDTVRTNVTSLPEKYPDVDFYYVFPPYSAVWWAILTNQGSVYKQIEAEKMVIEEILKYPNIKLFSFNMETDITTDINYYKDYNHYGKWVNSFILKSMKKEKYLLTKDNYEKYLDEEREFYTSFDYLSLNDQVDYEDDQQAAKNIKKVGR